LVTVDFRFFIYNKITYLQITAFNLFNKGKSKMHIFPPPTGPSLRATYEQKQCRPSPNRKETSW